MKFLIVKWIGGILGGLAVAWIVYAGLIRPTTKPPVTETQIAERLTNINYSFEPRQTFFGCASYRVTKEKEKK